MAILARPSAPTNRGDLAFGQPGLNMLPISAGASEACADEATHLSTNPSVPVGFVDGSFQRAPSSGPETAAYREVPADAGPAPNRNFYGLKTYVNLNRHVIASGLSSLYRLWLLCRDLDVDGRGVVSMDALRTRLQAHGLGRTHLLRAQSHPQCVAFLTFSPHKVAYRSLQSVCLSLKVTPGRCLYISRQSVESTKGFRAALYGAWIASHDELFISRERLTKLFNVSADTLRRWEQVAGVVITYNVVEVEPTDESAAAAHIPQDARLDHLDRLGRSYTWEYQGTSYYRSVNHYQAPRFMRGRVGNTRKVTRVVRQAGLPVYDHGDGTVQSAPRQRVFFSQRVTPQNYQERPGPCLRATQRVIQTPRGRSTLWRFSQRRPLARQQVWAHDH